jgi:hypothetical protein
MKSVASGCRQVVETPDWEAAELDDLKEIYFPDDDDGEIFVRFHTRWACEAAGYRVVRLEKIQYHPVYVVRLVRTTAPRIDDEALLFQHIRQILDDNGIRPKKSDLMVQRTGDRIHVSFLLEPPATQQCKQQKCKQKRRRHRRPESPPMTLHGYFALGPWL